MEIENQIKKYRSLLSLSQEQLGERIYVTRQTISNWENGKSYPDINSLILLSSVFEISVDELIKGDLKDMKKIISKETIRDFKKLSNLFSIGFVIMLLSIGPLVYFLKWIGIIIWIVIYIATLVLGFKVEKMKKENNIHTYKEIVAFMQGEKLDEIEKAKEDGKRYYQMFVSVLLFGVLGFIISYIMLKMLKIIVK